ncbi:S8 family serine peptidase [Streptomyces sp. NPDC048332]|uniref:S8 family peptidase n=1 Tax=Streptomyces sp. NPDC048332 TaxID=3154619 RepID=UPI00343664DA
MGRLSRTRPQRPDGAPRQSRRPRTLPTALAGGLAVALVATAPGTAAAAPGWEQQAMSVPAAHAVSKGGGVTVAVIDTGIRTSHPVLAGRAENGPDFLDENDQDESWYGKHGTAMASNVLDVAPEAKVLGLRAIRDDEDPKYQTWKEAMQKGPESGDNANSLRNAINYAVEQHVRVISMSLGGSSAFASYESSDADAIQYALSKGITVIASAGNDGDMSEVDETGNGGGENNLSYPAAYPGVLAVAASQPGGSRATFSSVHNYVDVAAPGVAVNSADHKGSGRAPVNGTSPAAALTAGVAALLLSKYPKLSPAQVTEVLKKTASHPSSYSPLTGYGQIDAAAALRAAAKVKGTGTMAVGTATSGTHFGPGDDGTPVRTGTGMDKGYLGLAAGLGATGLLAMAGGILLLRRARRSGRAAAVPAMPPAY